MQRRFAPLGIVKDYGDRITTLEGSSGAVWGQITGTLSDQTDLQSALDAKAASSHSHAASDITSGTFADALIAQSNVTQHQAAITITESQISDLGSYLTAVPATESPLKATELSSGQNLDNLVAAQAGFYYQTSNADTAGNNYPNGHAGSLLVQKSAANATQLYITYPTTGNKMFFRSRYTGSYSAWREVIDGANTQTVGGTKTFTTNPKRNGQGGYIHHNSSSYTDGGVTVSTSAPSGGTNGDIWLKY